MRLLPDSNNAIIAKGRVLPFMIGIASGGGGGESTPAPVFTTQPTATPLSAVVGQTVTLSLGIASNSTSLTGRLMQGGIDRTSQIADGVWSPSVAGAYTWGVTATGVGGSATSNTISGTITAQGAAVPSAPVSLTQPTLSGGKDIGNTVTVNPGTWSGYPAPTLTHKLQRRLGTTGTYVDYVNLTGLEYTFIPADVGYQFRVVETASNGVGPSVLRNGSGAIGPVTDTSGTGDPGGDGGTSPVDPSTTAPVSLTPPTVTYDHMEVGAPLMLEDGGWNGEPTSFSYRWMRGPANSGPWETVVNYGPSNSWTPRPQDEGYFVLGSVRATNAVGTSNRNAVTVGPVAAQPSDASPALLAAPHIRGRAAPGEIMVAMRGVWEGYPRPTLDVRWSRSLDGVTWDVIAGATARTYTVQEADRGYQISVEEQASNPFGSVSWQRSDATGVVGDLPEPVFSEPAVAALAAANSGVPLNPSFFKTDVDYGSTFQSEALVQHSNSIICDLRTPYSPSNHVVHPFVIEMTPSFRGYRYLCAITALPGGVDYYEDPFLYGSNDRINWEYVPGIANPIDTPSNDWSYHSDTFLSQDPRDGGLLVCWREAYAAAAGDKYVPTKTSIRLKYTKTLDGITWTPKAVFFESLQSDDNCLAPAILYDATDGLWHMWACQHPRFHHYTAPELDGPWTMEVMTTTFPRVAATSTATPHHGEVKWLGDKLVYLCSERWTGEQFVGIIDPANRASVSWVPHSIITADGSQPFPTYKASMLPIHEGGNWRLGLWYTGIGGTEKVFKYGESQPFTWTAT